MHVCVAIDAMFQSVASAYGFVTVSFITWSFTMALGRHKSARKTTGKMISTPVQQQRIPRVLSVKFFLMSALNWCERLRRRGLGTGGEETAMRRRARGGGGGGGGGGEDATRMERKKSAS
jgi:uncharacterized membrane protein YgcG